MLGDRTRASQHGLEDHPLNISTPLEHLGRQLQPPHFSR